MAGEWQRREIGKAFQVNPARTIKRGQVTPFIPMDALPGNARTPSRVDEREFTGSGVKFQNGDTLIARITPCLENGKTAFVSELPEGVVAHGSTEYIVLAGKPGESDNLFAYYLARSPEFRAYAIGHMEGTSGRQRVPSVAVENYATTLPPLLEQRAIAHILGTLDDKIELNRRMNETLEAIARAIFKSWFVDFDPVRAKASGEAPESICRRLGLTPDLLALFPTRLVDSELGVIPEGWDVRSIGEVVQVVGGSTPSTKTPEYWEDGSFYWATPKDLSGLTVPILLETGRKITDLGLKQISSGLLPAGTVLMSSRAPIGYLAIAAVPVAINQGFIAIPPGPVSAYYMLNWCHSNMDAVKQRAGGTTFAEISKSSFRPIPALIPSAEVLHSFTGMVQPIYNLISDRCRESASLSEIRDTLLPKLVSGELRVPPVAD